MLSSHDILNHIAALADDLKLANLQPQIAACRKQFSDSSHGIDVAVFGRFKAGKSSFLNHLTGRAVLPIGVVPLTAVITRLRYGETERAEVRFLNGTPRQSRSMKSAATSARTKIRTTGSRSPRWKWSCRS